MADAQQTNAKKPAQTPAGAVAALAEALKIPEAKAKPAKGS
jgi:hypothetical protein